MTEKHISNLEDHLGYWLRCLSNYIHHSFAEKLAIHNVSVAQWVVLRTLYEEEGVTLRHVASTIGVDKSTLSRMIERLVKNELVKRVEGIDRRSLKLTLTEFGKELVPKLALLADENDEVFFKSLGSKQREELQNIVKNLLNDNGWEKSKRGLDRME